MTGRVLPVLALAALTTIVTPLGAQLSPERPHRVKIVFDGMGGSPDAANAWKATLTKYGK